MIKKINYKQIIIIIAILFLVISIYIINQTYSKYLSSADAKSATEIAKWHILVNNTHITSGTDFSNSIEPIFPGNDHIKEGIIAPSAEGYFDLLLDFEEVDVSFKYTISMELSEDNAVPDLVIMGYSFDEGDNIEDFIDDSFIEETITIDSNLENRSIRVYVKWDDDALTETMDNKADTLVTTDSDNYALIDVIIDFTQVTE